MALLGLTNQYPVQQSGTSNTTQVASSNLFVSGNPFMPAGFAYPMGTSMFFNPEYAMPMIPPMNFNFLGGTSFPNFGSLTTGTSSVPSIFSFTPNNNRSQSAMRLSTGNLGKDIVATAQKYIGYNEKDGSYKKFTGGRQEAWCADFATYVTKEAYKANGKSVPSGFGSSSVAGLKSWGMKNGRYIQDVSQAKPGDIVIFNRSHTGIVKEVLADGTVVTIEGNTSDKVAERKYSPSSGKINGFVQLA